MPDFTKQDYALIIEALERRQYSYMTGDKMFKEYESLVNDCLLYTSDAADE